MIMNMGIKRNFGKNAKTMQLEKCSNKLFTINYYVD